MVDQMDLSTLCQLAYDLLVQTYSTYTEEQLRAEVKEWAEDLLEECDVKQDS